MWAKQDPPVLFPGLLGTPCLPSPWHAVDYLVTMDWDCLWSSFIDSSDLWWSWDCPGRVPVAINQLSHLYRNWLGSSRDCPGSSCGWLSMPSMSRGTALVPSCITITATGLIRSARACTHLVHGGRSAGRTKGFCRGQLMLGHFLVCPAWLTSRLCSSVGRGAFFFFNASLPCMQATTKCFSCHGRSKTLCSLSLELHFSKGLFTGVICYVFTCHNRCCLSLLFLREERAAYYWTYSAYWLKNMFIADGENLNLRGVIPGSSHKVASPNM